MDAGNPPNIEAIEITQVRDALDLLSNEDIRQWVGAGDQYNDDSLWFRGHTNITYELVPSAHRPDALANPRLNESATFHRYRLGPFGDRYMSMEPKFRPIAIAADMQHYSIPTRVLDWTRNILVALYFATEKRDDTDGSVILYKPPHNLIAAGDSFDARIRLAAGQDLGEFKLLSHSHEARILLRGHPDAELPDHDNYDFLTVSNVIPIVPFSCNPYITAQQGVFTVHGGIPGHQNQDEQPRPIPHEHFKTFRIPAAAKAGIRRDLHKLFIRKATLFPNIDNFSKGIIHRAD